MKNILKIRKLMKGRSQILLLLVNCFWNVLEDSGLLLVVKSRVTSMSNNISLIQEISLPVIIGEWKDKENWRIEKEKQEW